MIYSLGLKIGFIGPVDRYDVLADIEITEKWEGDDPRCENTLFCFNREDFCIV